MIVRSVILSVILSFVLSVSRIIHDSGVTTAPADPATQGARESRGALVSTPKKFFQDSCRLYIVVLMDAAQFTSNCSIAGRGPYDHVLQPLQGGICSYPTGPRTR